MKEIDIFNVTKIDDLPKEVKKEIISARSFQKSVTDTERLLSLFDIKNPLTLDEIVVGLWRKYKIIHPRRWSSTTCWNLINSGKIITIGRGCYKKVRYENH